MRKEALAIYLDDYGLEPDESDRLFDRMDVNKKGKLYIDDFVKQYKVFNQVVDGEAVEVELRETTLLKRGAPPQGGFFRGQPEVVDGVTQLSQLQWDVCEQEFGAKNSDAGMRQQELGLLLGTQLGRQISDVEIDVLWEAMVSEAGMVTFDSYMTCVWGQYAVQAGEDADAGS